MALCNVCVRKSIKVICKPQSDIQSICYACPDDVLTIGCAPDDCNLTTDGVVNTLLTDPLYGFYEIDGNNTGDNKMQLSWNKTNNDDGTTDTTQEFTIRIESDDPTTRALISALCGLEVHLLVKYNGCDFPFELLQNVQLVQVDWNSANSGRGHDLIFRKTNTERGKLVWDTDLATTEAMIDAAIAP